MVNVIRLLLLACFTTVIGGCMKADAPQFKSNVFEMDLRETPAEQRPVIANALEAMFGTPDAPFVLPESGLDINKIQLAAGPVWSDEHGLQRGLYRQQCVHCHGITGDGMGPTAAILNPYPRDYRQGKYKYKSTERASMPTHADLERILRHGIMGTAMPTFDLLAPGEVDALIEYVKYLSLRGQVEISLILAVGDLGENDQLKLERGFLVDEILKPEVEKWTSAPETIINPPPRPELALTESIDKGRELYFGAKANCVKCHGPSALGDGQASDYDDWQKPLGDEVNRLKTLKLSLQTAEAAEATDIKKEIDTLEDRVDELQAFSLPLRTITPRNLRMGIYRFGRRPLDLYRRLHAGINGAPMPGAAGTISPDEMWHIVDYVRALPYESLAKPPGEKKVAQLDDNRAKPQAAR